MKIKYCVLGCWIGGKKKYGICGYNTETLKYVTISEVKFEFDNADDAIKEAEKLNRKRKHEKETV